MKSNSVILWGGTGQARVVADIMNKDAIVAIFDNDVRVANPINCKEIPVFHGKREFEQWREENKNEEICFVTTIGWAKGKVREEISKYLIEHGLKPINVIHPQAVVADDVQFGINNQIMSMVHLGVNTTIGNNCIINTGSIIEHQCIIGDNVDIAPGCVLLGEVEIGNGTAIGAGTIIMPKVRIGENVVIGAGSVVSDNIESNKKLICHRKEIIYLK